MKLKYLKFGGLDPHACTLVAVALGVVDCGVRGLVLVSFLVKIQSLLERVEEASVMMKPLCFLMVFKGVGDWDFNASWCYLFNFLLGFEKTCVCIIDFLVDKRDLFCCVWMHRNTFFLRC